MFSRSWNKTKIGIISSLLKRELSIDELSSTLNVSKPNLRQKYLEDLEKEGIVEKIIVKTRVGRQARYKLKPFTMVISLDPQSGSALSFTDHSRIDPDRLLLQQVDPDFRGDIDKFFDVMDRSILDECVIILFGSVAIGKGTKKSDIDLLFLKGSWEENNDLISKAEMEVSLDVEHQINSITYTTDEFLKKDKVFFKEIKKEGIILRGSFEKDGEVWHQMKRYSSITP